MTEFASPPPTPGRPDAPERARLARPRGGPRPSRRLLDRPDPARDLRLPGPDAGLAGRPGDGDHGLPAADRSRQPRPDPVPPDEPVHVEALEASLPVAREPLRLRGGVPRRPRRQHHPGPLGRRGDPRLVRPGPLVRTGPPPWRSGRWASTRRWCQASRGAGRSSSRRASGSSSTASRWSPGSCPGCTGSWPGPTAPRSCRCTWRPGSWSSAPAPTATGSPGRRARRSPPASRAPPVPRARPSSPPPPSEEPSR